MKKNKHALAQGCAILALCAAASPVFAQDAVAAKPSPAAGDKPEQAGESVVVITGSARPQRRFDVSYDVNALSKNEVKTLAPRSFGELLAHVPGIQTEPTGGEVGAVTRNRGIPTDDGGIIFQQDGLTLLEDVNGNSYRGDDLNRYDLMTNTVEVVRGGPAPIYASQASAIVNNITVTGGPVAKGQIQVTGGTTGLLRLDAVESGPLGHNTYFAIGGFLRRDDGPRPDKYGPNDQGGQLRANIKHIFDDGSSVKVTANYLNDSNGYYLPIPLSNPATGQSLDKYIDYFKGTFNTPRLVNTNIKYVDEAGVTQNLNVGLRNGRHTNFGNIGIQYDGNFHGWNLAAKAGFSKGDVTFDAFFSSNNPVDANAFTTQASKYAINGKSALAAAQSAYGNQVTSVGYAVAGTSGAQTYDPYAASGLVVVSQYQHREIEFYSNQADVSLTREFDTAWGTHDIRMGVYAASWGAKDKQAYQNYLTELASNPRLLDLVAYNAASTKVGMVTSNGLATNATTLQQGEADSEMAAIYFNDSWQVTDQIRLDAGARHEDYFGSGWSKVTAAANITTANTLVTATRAFTGAIVTNKVHPQVNNWTLGANYDFNKHFGGYIRLSHLDTPPVQVNLYAVQSTAATNLALKSTHANQYEIGLKSSFGKSYFYLTGFATNFNPLAVNYTDLVGTSVTLLAKARDVGVELDGSLHLFQGLAINFTGTVSKPEYLSLVDAAGTTYPAVEGKQLIREPKAYYSIRPQYDFTSGDTKYSVYARYDYTGNRYVDVGNTTALPSYAEWSAGMTAKLSNGWDVQVVGNNLTNAHGLTEGNPRSDVLSGQGTAVAFYGRPIFGRAARLIVSRSW